MMLIVILALTGVAIFLLSRPRTSRSTYRGAGTRANAHGGGEFHALSSFDSGSGGFLRQREQQRRLCGLRKQWRWMRLNKRSRVAPGQ